MLMCFSFLHVQTYPKMTLTQKRKKLIYWVLQFYWRTYEDKLVFTHFIQKMENV